MSDEYTPTTQQVELDFAYLGGRSDEEDYDLRVPAFRRWLTTHDAEVAREAAEKALRDAADQLEQHGRFDEPVPVLLRARADRLAAGGENKS